jgi:hypothetical protein
VPLLLAGFQVVSAASRPAPPPDRPRDIQVDLGPVADFFKVLKKDMVVNEVPVGEGRTVKIESLALTVEAVKPYSQFTPLDIRYYDAQGNELKPNGAGAAAGAKFPVLFAVQPGQQAVLLLPVLPNPALAKMKVNFANGPAARGGPRR